MTRVMAPELQVEQWLNTESPVSLEALRGRVVFIEAFQMLCPGCVSHGLPQAGRVADTFSRDDVVVLGLHSVFEHHAVQGGPDALAAFLHEYRIRFPVGIDAPAPGGGVPKTMAAYRLRGTPTSILIARHGRLRSRHFGRVGDMALGAEIMALTNDYAGLEFDQSPEERETRSTRCDDDGCAVPHRRRRDSANKT